MQTLTVRAATPDDLPDLAALWYENTVLQQQADPRIRIAPGGEQVWARAAARWLDEPTTALLVAQGTAIAGYLLARVQPGTPGLLPERMGVIAEMAIDLHGYHGGAGRHLFDGARAWFAAQDVHEVVIMVSRRHAVEQAFWRALGAKDWTDCLLMTF